jgi:hypothetical protein
VFSTNQVHPEPKLVAAEVEKASLNLAKSQKISLIFLAIFQLASQPAF